MRSRIPIWDTIRAPIYSTILADVQSVQDEMVAVGNYIHSSMFRNHSRFTVLAAMATSLFAFGCLSPELEITGTCIGAMDTLISQKIVIHNAGDPIWRSEDGWQIIEEIRYGSGTAGNSIFFGSIRSFDVDRHGNLFVLDGQTQETYVLDPDGMLVRTIGSRGAGPGEFEEASAVDVSENGEIWIMEMRKGQLTVMDAEGNYQKMERINSVGYTQIPYRGGFDKVGRYNAFIECYDGVKSQEMFARFDQSLTPVDTIAIPKDPVESDFFIHHLPSGGSIRAAVPYQGAFGWLFSVDGNFWTLRTTSAETYELVEFTAGGSPLRRVRRELEPVQVTGADRTRIQEDLFWFTDQGGTIDMNRIPPYKPVASRFFSDDQGNLWVMRTTTMPEQQGTLFDVFDAEGVFLGEVLLPFPLRINPGPVVKGNLLYGMMQSEDGGEIIVRAQIQKIEKSFPEQTEYESF